MAPSHVLGLSFDGVIAQRFAMDHPSRIAQIVLVSCTYRFTPYLRAIARLIRHTLRWFSKSVFARAMEVLGSGPTRYSARMAQYSPPLRGGHDDHPRTDLVLPFQIDFGIGHNLVNLVEAADTRQTLAPEFT